MIKEFLKPNLGKIILTIAFGWAAYNLGINIYGVPACYPVGGGLQPAVLYPSYDPILWGPLVKLAGYNYCVKNTNEIERLIFGIIYWYLIASVIMSAYSILKRKNS